VGAEGNALTSGGGSNRSLEKLHNEELQKLYFSDIITVVKRRKVRSTEHAVRMGKMTNSYNVFIRKPEGDRLFGKPRRREKNDIKLNLKEVSSKDVDWIYLAQYRDQL
jgi:hypothetical protein